MASKKTAFKAASQSAQKKKKRTSEQAQQQQSQESRARSASSSENRATQETRTGGGRDIRVQNALEDRRTITMPKRSVSTQGSRTRKSSAADTSSAKANDSREQKRKTLTQEKKEALYGSKQSAKARRENPFARNDDDFDATQMYILPIGLGNDSIESFLFDSQDYVNGANSRLSSIRPGVDSHTATYNGLVSSAESLSGRAASIRAHLNTNRDQYSDEYYEEIMSYLDSFDEYASGVSRQAKNYEELVNRGLSQNQFNAELRDRYYTWQFRGNISNPDQSEIERLRNYANTAWEQGDDQAAREYEDQINWLSENTTGGRMWRYEQNNARIEEITRQLEEIERTYRPGETGVVNASREELRSDLISEKKNLETWNRQYERGEERGTDITNFTRNAPDFNEYSHADNYGDPNLDEIEADRAQVYGIADQEGNVYIDDGSFTNMTPVLDGGPSPSPTTLRDFKDPLGAYLSWSDEQKSQYVQQPNTSYGAVADAGTSGNWDFINDNELAVYYYYLNKGNLTAAQAYLRSLDGTLLDRAKNQLSEDIQNASAGELFIRNVISVPQQVVGGVAAFGGAIGNALRGEGFRSGNAGMWQFAAGQTRAETAGRIDEATGNKSLLGISLGDAYQASMSALDSIFGGTFAGKAYTVFMGMGAAAQKAEEAYLSGASDQEIVSTALIAGALEYLSEQIAWDKLVGTPTPTTAKKAVINALEQAGFEGTEEVVSSVGNNIADLLIMGDRSAFETTKRQLLAENPNMTDSDANFEALKMSLGDLWKDFVGGAISGLGMGGAESFFGAFSGEGYKQYRDAYKQAGLSLENSGATDAVLDTARVTSQEQTNAADKQNARDVSRAQKELSESASRAQALTERARAARNTAQSSGSAESDTRPFASAVRDYYNQIHAKNLSNRAAVEVGRTVQLTSDTMDALNRVDKDNTEDRDVRFFQGLRGISPAQAAQNAVSDESKRQGMEYVADESKRALAVSDDGRAHDAQGNTITIDGVADVQDGKLMLATTDGEILPADLISYATPEEALVYETIQRMNVSKASAIALSEAYKAGEVSAQEFALGVNQAYNFGRIGVDMDKAISRSESFAANLTQQQRITAYRMGRIDAQTSFDAQQSAIDTRVANAAKSADVKIGKVIYEFDNSGFRMNEQQRQGVQIAKMVSALTGADVHLYESYDRDGTRYYKDASGNEAVAPNGFYSNGSVWVDVNAGNNGQGIVGVTLSHEFTHFIQEWSPEKFKVLGDYVIRRFNESNVNVDALVRAQMEKANRARGEVLSYDEAYAEVVADSMEQMFTGEKSQALEQLAELKKQDATLWGKIKEWFKRIAKRLTAIRKAYSDVDADNETAAVVRGIDNFVEQASKIFAEGLDEAGKNYMAAVGEQSLQTQTIYEGRDIDGDPGTHLMSDRSMVEAAGLYFDYNAEDGTFRILDREGGTEVKSVTAEDIKASPLGAMINYAVKTPSNPSGTISAADARKQYRFFSDLINMCIEKNDVAMVWETTGSLVFSAIKNNADPQYTKTIDFSTICKKTKQLINVMSEAMKAKGRGLTRSEVENAYLQTGLAGEATPCPVCYVFARWIGVGGILDQISEFQKRYGAMDESQLRGFMEDMDARIAEYYEGLSESKKENLTGKNGQMKAGGVLSDMKSKATNAVNAATRKLADNAMYVADVEALDTLISQLDPNADAKQILDAKKERRKTASKIVDNDALIRAYDDAVDVVNEYEAYQYLSRVMMQQTEDGTWVKREGFEPVPNEILFDLNRGDDFARNYPLAWSFRTGKGASAGKAILPYSDARLGEIVQGIGYADISNIGVGEENMFLNGDTQAAQKRIDAARAKARAQNLLGGTRFQSTSDFRYEFGSDYLLSFLEMQAIGSKVQLYTKVIEAVDFFATMGADVNLSVMPLNDGYITMEDGTKKLVYSPVTGVNGEAAIKKAKEYDNVQLILVGISDEHIRLALSGEDVTFVIPFHGSGNSTAQIQRLMELVGENLDLTQARDYTAVQNDHVMEKRSAAQKAAWDLRVKILTGEAGKLSSAEQMVLEQNPYLSDLYERFYVDESAEEYGVKLGSAQAAIVFPFEYWDKSLDYAHADENGERFKEYCRTLGLIPRFSGMNSSGENVGYGDFSNDPGYWKLLIDRKMYNNVYDADGNWTGYGTYHVQQPIDVSNFNVSLIDPEVRNALYSDVMSKDAKPEKTSIIAQAVIDNITADSYAQAAREEAVKNAIEKKQNQTKHSTRDDSYLDAVEDGEATQRQINSEDEETAQRIIANESGVHYSSRDIDAETLDMLESLDEDELITTYRSMQLIDGKLYPPMAAVVSGSMEDASQIGSWERAVEHPELVKIDNKGRAKFTLNKGKGQGTISAAYNPYMHSSNLMLNDQFTGAYKRPNLVTVECVVPASEMTSGYHAEFAKDATGWHEWHAGPVASNAIEQRNVFLSRWLKPVRIVDNAEVAREYKRLLSGTNASVPYNVVSPGLLAELEKIGVPIDDKGSGKVPPREDIRYSVREDSEGRELSEGQEDYFAESAIRDKNGALQVMYHATDNEFTVFSREYLGENTYAWSEEAQATAHIGFWFNTQNLSQNGKALYARAEEVYLNVTNPYDAGSLDGLVRAIAAVNEESSEDPSEIGENFRDWLEENGYDGVRLHDEEFGGTSVVALYPEQIKRVNNLNPTSDPDVRFSLRDTSSVDIATVEKENAQLREANEELRKQFRRTAGVQLDQKAIRKMARDLLKQYDSSYDVDTLTDNLSKVFDVVANGGLTWDEASNAVVDMCRKVLEESSSFDTGLYEYDQPVRDYLKNVRLEIGDDMRGGIELVADNVASYRRGLFGIVGMARKGSGVSIGQMWREASEMFPTYFSEDIVNPEDQAERLYYLAQSLKRPSYFTNVYEQNIDAAAYDMMLQIGAKYLDVPQSKTFADKFAEKLETARKASRDAIRQKAAELRAQQKTANRTEKRLDAKITQMARVMLAAENRANRYQEQLATERETAKQRIRDIRTENAQEKQKLAEEYRQKNKEKLAELRENYNRNKLTRQISDSLSSIRKLFENGRGTANVKQGMRDTVQATLRAAEVLFGEDDTISAHDVIMSSTLPASAAERALIDQYRNAVKSLVNATYLADNGIDVNANRRLAGKARRLMASLSQQLSSYVERAKQARTGVAVDTVIQTVSDAYEQLKDSNDGYISAAYDANIAQYLANLKYVLNGKTIANMNNDELKSLRNAFRGVLWTIREQNAAFVSERRETVKQRGTDTMDEVTVANPDRQTKNTTLAGIRKALGWDNLKPFYAFERMQSPTLMRLFQNVRAGEDVWAVDVNEARDYFQNLARQYGYFDIDRSKRFTFTDKSGKAFELSIPQMMSLYAYSKRAAAMQHLENGGFVFDDTVRLTDQKGKTKKNVAYNIKQAHVIDQSIVQDVVNELQKQNAGYLTFVDQMQSYLSKTMGAKGNEVSMKLYGVEMFGEAFYFPIITPGDNGSKPIVVNDTFKIKNSGFTQVLNPNAVGTIVLSDFMDVWAKHINDMAMYHAFTLPLEDMNRVMNYRVRNENGVVTDSVRMRLTNAFTSDAVNYINQFMTDINNGIRGDNRETFVKRMLSGFKKAKVFVNASVVIQQYSAIVRALDVIDAKYFVGVDKQSIGKKWNEVKRFAPIAAVKEMGHFDTGISGSTEEYIQKRSYQGIGENVKAFFTDRAQTEAALSFAPEFADKIAWTQIWSACKRKAADLNPNLSGDALLQKAGEYFTDAIVRTQVYDSTLSKSGLMRSKSAFLNMATAFMAEPTTTLNMLQHSLSDAKRGKPRAALRTVGSVFGSVMLNALLASIVFAARDDDEDKTYLEKYFAAVTSDFLDEINPLTMAPIVKDAWSLLQGYDVERSDMTLMSDTISRIKSLVQTLSNLDPKAEGKELEEQNLELRNQVISAATAVANLFGIPFDNIVRDIRALFNTFGNAVPIKDTNGEMIRDSVLSALQEQIPVWNWLKDAESTSDKLYDAIRDGNAEYFARLTRGYEKDSQTNSAIQRALKENEDRITEAAKARMEGRINDYKALVRQMVSEYGLAHAGETTVQDNIIKAINAVIRELENKPSDDSYKPTKQLKMDDYVTAMANGRDKDANTARETIIQEMVDYDGKTQDKAEESFVSSAVSAARSRYEDGEISEQTALRIIMDAKDCSKSDAQYTMTMWELQRKNPDVSNGRIEKWYNDVKSSGISLAVYNDYAVRMAECKGVDSDGDGKADPNTAKEQKLAVIDSLPISNEQKDFLYRLNNWAESKLYQAPWH